MENISEIYVTDYIPSPYTTPCAVEYLQNGKLKRKEILQERNGVIIVVYNKTRNTLVLVKQFRAAAYFQSVPEADRKPGTKINTKTYPVYLGITLEFCAGLEDKTGYATKQIAIEEIYEECGYKVGVDQLEEVCCFKNLTETTGARSTLYYCEVTEEMRVGSGGGVDDEFIEVVEMDVDAVVNYAKREFVNSPINFMFALYWFLENKYKK